jgi:hypothetical protein
MATICRPMLTLALAGFFRRSRVAGTWSGDDDGADMQCPKCRDSATQTVRITFIDKEVGDARFAHEWAG